MIRHVAEGWHAGRLATDLIMHIVLVFQEQRAYILQRRAAAMRMELTPVANEARFIRAQLQGRRISSEFGCNHRHRSIHTDISTPLLRL
jgi:hypothetical protein